MNLPAAVLVVVALIAALPATAHATALALSAPTSLRASALDGRYVQLAWQRSAADDGTYRYRVYRDGIAIGNWQVMVTYLDRPALGLHTYQARAVDVLGTLSPLSSSVSVTAVSRIPGAVAPATPINLSYGTGARGQAHLSWSRGSGGTSATHAYRIYRNGMVIATVMATSFDDYRAGRPASSYDYAVQAVDVDGYASALTATVRIGVTPSLYPWAGIRWLSGPTTAPLVALTFDDCNSGKVVKRIANILRSNNAPGTFFCTGEAAALNADVLADVARDFPVGNHTYDHADLNTLTEDQVMAQLRKGTKYLEAATGRPLPPIMRPPYGHADAGVRADCGQFGLAVVRWNIDTNDWRRSTTSQDVLRTALQATNGSIVLMHDKTKTADVLAQIIAGLRARGYRLVTVTELLGIPWLPAERDAAATAQATGPV